MRIDWWTLGLQAINVLVLIWILSRFLFRPVAAIVAARQAQAAQLLSDAASAKADAAAERQQAADEAARQAADRGKVLEAAAQDAAGQKASLLAAARTEADQLRAAAQADIARLKAGEAEELNDRAGRLAVDIAARVLAGLPDDVRIAPFIDGLAAAVASLPETTRAEVGADGAPLRLKVARPLSPAEADSCRTRLAGALGRPVSIRPEPDPGLIAGLELETPHAVVRNSLRANLDRITAELTRHDPAGR